MDVVQLLIDLIFQPGSSLWLIPAINVTCLVLIALLAFTGFYSEVAAIHFYVMSFLAFGLLLSVNWFYREFQIAVAAKNAGQAVVATSANGDNNNDNNSEKEKES